MPHVDVDGDGDFGCWLRSWPLARANIPKIELGGNSGLSSGSGVGGT